MSSRLFHTVVAFGISLGAASAGCAAASDAGPDADQGGLASAESTDKPAAPAPDPFCDRAWPATKGTTFTGSAPECTNPKHACQPSMGDDDLSPGWEERIPHACLKMTSDMVCSGDAIFSVCVDGKWACKPGMVALYPGKFVGEDCACWATAANPSVCAQPQ